MNAEQHLSAWVGRHGKVNEVVKMPGDASTRSYYRVKTSARSYVLMQMEPFEESGNNVPFLVVQRHLRASGVDVPEVIDTDPSQGLILLEDLGDEVLLRRLQGVSDTDIERRLYEHVIDELVTLQVNASPGPGSPDIEPFRLRFDFEKLDWEVNFTIEHFYQQYLKRNVASADMKLMREGLADICQQLANEPTVFTHRDFHCRNVMVVPGQKRERLVMIDFQDARMGPPQYDLASLLKDSYYQLEEAQIQRLLDYYIARFEAVSGKKIKDRAHFRKIFDLMSVQRNFKAIGSFASFQNKRNVSTYLKYIGNTFENIRRNLLKYPEYTALREVLFHYYYF